MGSQQEQAQKTDHFTYVSDSALSTTNAGTNEGSASNAQVIAGRLYPGTYVLGPKGQLIPNTDLAETSVLPASEPQVVYRINPEAKYSDGQPVTCDSFLLAVTAGKHPQLFDAHLPMMEQISRVECPAGTRTATVTFKPGFGERWRQLFGPGVLLPTHAVAAKLGMSLEELNTTLKSGDEAMLEPIAQVWREGFNLASFDPQLQVSYGPFKVVSVGEQGEVVLERNDFFNGGAAPLSHVEMWPRTADLKALRESGDLRVVDTESAVDLSWLDRDNPENPFAVELISGILTEQLVLGSSGLFYDEEARRQFAACVDQPTVAAESSRISGVEVEPLFARTVRSGDPAVAQMGDIIEPHRHTNMDYARGLAGQTVRIGYEAPDARKAAMVEAIRVSCEQAGITVVDVSEQAHTFGDLSRTYISEWGYETYAEGSADAILQAIDPMAEFPEIATPSTNLEAARNAERDSWQRVNTIPLAAQPRVYVTHRAVGNVVSNTDLSGIGWNMGRWRDATESE
ncbi:ABC transporter substrate-binding protein [Corynebacterium kozikiae]|uniref:ABC transporter substrate-binding protein n=1 Tax=Corynebacterium kozikiae TaxID=2968469 RepID=UPI0027963B57|nr:ABC transporter substrate-binding protein [Corynebacterium sp. 76QC2CO]